MTEILGNARLVSEAISPRLGWVEVAGSQITAVGFGARDGGRDLKGAYLAPGFVDMHVHGALGYSFHAKDQAECRKILDHHTYHGTTTMLAGIGSHHLDDMRRAAAIAAEVVKDGGLYGVFFEGPFLSECRRGAHDPLHLRAPNVAEALSLLEAARGTTKLFTLAPELPCSSEVQAAVRDENVVGAIGHTDASYVEARAAFDGGANVATHLFNGMRPIHHRDPGVVMAALEDPGVVCELVVDGHHVADPTVRFVFDHIGPSRIAMVTDAMAATGLGDGTYHGGRVVVRDGRAMLADGSSIAGSTITMDCAVRHAVLDVGLPLQDVITAVTATPARTLGVADRGRLASGARADLVVMSAELDVVGVMHAGAWVPRSSGEESYVAACLEP